MLVQCVRNYLHRLLTIDECSIENALVFISELTIDRFFHAEITTDVCRGSHRYRCFLEDPPVWICIQFRFINFQRLDGHVANLKSNANHDVDSFVYMLKISLQGNGLLTRATTSFRFHLYDVMSHVTLKGIPRFTNSIYHKTSKMLNKPKS